MAGLMALGAERMALRALALTPAISLRLLPQSALPIKVVTPHIE
jgi:hypothetical protein